MSRFLAIAMRAITLLLSFYPSLLFWRKEEDCIFFDDREPEVWGIMLGSKCEVFGSDLRQTLER